jgi:hypothetical protein
VICELMGHVGTKRKGARLKAQGKTGFIEFVGLLELLELLEFTEFRKASKSRENQRSEERGGWGPLHALYL